MSSGILSGTCNQETPSKSKATIRQDIFHQKLYEDLWEYLHV